MNTLAWRLGFTPLQGWNAINDTINGVCAIWAWIVWHVKNSKLVMLTHGRIIVWSMHYTQRRDYRKAVKVATMVNRKEIERRWREAGGVGPLPPMAGAAEVTHPTLGQIAAAMPYPVVLPEEYGAVGNVKTIYDAEITEKTKVLKAKTSKPFTASSVGMYVTICSAGTVALLEGAEPGSKKQWNTLVAKITAFTNSEEVEIDTEATHTPTTATIACIATDDTKAFVEAMEALFIKAKEQGTGKCAIWPSKVYGIGGELKTGEKGLAQIPIPLVECTSAGTGAQGMKINFEIFGGMDASGLPLWFQKVPQQPQGTTVSFGPIAEVAATFTGEVTEKSATIKGVSSIASLVVGQRLSGEKIVPGSVIKEIKATEVVMSNVAEGAGSSTKTGVSVKTYHSQAQPEYVEGKGRPAIWGGPTPEQSYEQLKYSNVNVVLNGFATSAPSNGTMTNMELNGCANHVVGHGGHSAYAIGVPGLTEEGGEKYNEGPGEYVMASKGNEGKYASKKRAACALAPPARGNNDLGVIYNYSSQGHTMGVEPTEHTAIFSLRTVYCFFGGAPGAAAGNWLHMCTIDHWSIEASRFGMYTNYCSECQMNVTIDTETGAGRWGFVAKGALWDSENKWRGLCVLYYGSSAESSIAAAYNGCTKLTVKCLNLAPGKVTLATGMMSTVPTTPVSGTEYTNVSGRDAVVYVKATTLEKLEVDGVERPVFVAGGMMVVLKSLGTIKATGISLGEWTWDLL